MTEASAAAEVEARGTSRRAAFMWWLVPLLALWALDQATKAWAIRALEWNVSVPFIGEILQLHLIANPGAAFSLGSGYTWLFTILSGVVFGALTMVATRLRHRGWAVILGAFAAGVVGNLTDRLVRPPGFAVGHVIDFLQLPNWPIFNVADICVTGGAVALGIMWWRADVGPDGRPMNAEPTRGADDG